jgi:hypothetical protein
MIEDYKYMVIELLIFFLYIFTTCILKISIYFYIKIKEKYILVS